MKVKLSNVRIAYWKNQLFVPNAMEEGQKKKYGADFILTPGFKVQKFVRNPDGQGGKYVDSKMSEVLLEVANDAWKGRGKAVLDSLEASKKCLRNGSTKTSSSGEVYEGFDGHYYVSAKNAKRPDIRDRDKTPLTEADGRPYSGCYVTAIIDVYAMTEPTKKGVFAALLAVQFVGDGDAFAGGGATADDEDFDDLSAPEESNVDSLV